jgi:hypothetical protein
MAAMGQPAGWRAMAMGQLFPVLTVGAPGLDGSPLRETRALVTQPAAMLNVWSPGDRFSLHATLNFEGLTQRGGEPTFGGWGEGFIDRRHPHTLVHELILSLHAGEVAGGRASLSAGKGFAPFGTEDPMSRPGLKYPTNHHLSQVLERWLVAAAYARGGWSLEAGLFGGEEPSGPYDFSNIVSFGDSWSLRLSRQWTDDVTASAWELSASFADVAEEHGAEVERTRLWNAAARYEGSSTLRYGLAEASTSSGPGAADFFSVLAEARFGHGRHEPYLRAEYATRPEFARASEETSPGFFRYDHDAEPVGATRWLIGTAAYAVRLTEAPVSVRPFVEVQRFHVADHRGEVDPVALFGDDSFWAFTLGVRILLGEGDMRMGAYGVLDPMGQHSMPGM